MCGIVQIWIMDEVISLMNGVIDASGVVSLIERGQSLSDVQQYTAFFSMINLCRLYAKQGKFVEALAVIECVDLEASDTRVLAHVFKSFVTLCYYAGFAHMMGQRYSKAQTLFVTVLREFIRMQGSSGSVPVLLPPSFVFSLVNSVHVQIVCWPCNARWQPAQD
jgi:RNA polymerase I-associated factor PAF67